MTRISIYKINLYLFVPTIQTSTEPGHQGDGNWPEVGGCVYENSRGLQGLQHDTQGAQLATINPFLMSAGGSCHVLSAACFLAGQGARRGRSCGQDIGHSTPGGEMQGSEARLYRFESQFSPSCLCELRQSS